MARSIRASFLLLSALGVAASASPVASAATTNGGAAPTSVATVSSESTGGAVPGETPVGSSGTGKVASTRSGGARPGAKPAKRRKPAKPRTKRKPKATPAPPVAPAPTPPATPVVPTVAGVFPVAGAYGFGGEGARFGAGRPGHIHQGQDVVAAEGTPLVAPVSGTVSWKANQEGGAGIYLVIRGAGSGTVRDYVFMHLKRGSVLVEPGQAVSAGQQIAQVGSTGDASGPHLHFEIWVGGWYAKGGAPVDPLPQLQRWAG